METKECRCCGRSLPIEQFKSRGGGEYTSVCKSCVTEKRMKTYHENKEHDEHPRDPRLAEFHGRELIAELRHRGYKGELKFEETITHTIKL